ncbi:MAG: hypothetical protein JXB13_13245 [Phycisphaerae bacterium]|nr:hypothetical protein [Phycisphaerae bacterium]
MNLLFAWLRPSTRVGRGRLQQSVIAILILASASVGACKNKPKPIEPGAAIGANDNQPPTAAAPAGAPALPPGHPPIPSATVPASPAVPPGAPPISPAADDATAATQPVEQPPVPLPVSGTQQTKLEGITLTVPQGWAAQPVRLPAGMPAALAPKAVYRLATGPADPDPVHVRVSHFPEMRALDNLVQSNLDRWYNMFQQPDGRPTAQVARTEMFEAGPCRVTVTHLTGDMGRLRSQGMIGAIIEHPNGPFFVKATGSATGVRAWTPHIEMYLRSIQAAE